MSILTEKEREDVYKYWLQSSTLTNEDGLIRLAEKAVLEKLAGMELPDPAVLMHGDICVTPKAVKDSEKDKFLPLYNATQLHQAFAQGAASQLNSEIEAYLVYDPASCSEDLFFDDELGDVDGKTVTPLYTLKAPK